jgi:hypothetical protein
MPFVVVSIVVVAVVSTFGSALHRSFPPLHLLLPLPVDHTVAKPVQPNNIVAAGNSTL